MAIQFARIEILNRKNGGNACRKGAYNARSKITDEKTGEIFDFTKAPDVSSPYLPYAASFTVVALSDSEAWVVGFEDEQSCFCLYALPKVWQIFFLPCRRNAVIVMAFLGGSP